MLRKPRRLGGPGDSEVGDLQHVVFTNEQDSPASRRDGRARPSCACCNPAHAWSASGTASSCASFPRSASVSPSTYSMTMYGLPSASPASYTWTTFGCESRLASLTPAGNARGSRVARQMLREDLDRDEAAQLFVVRQIDDRHAAVGRVFARSGSALLRASRSIVLLVLLFLLLATLVFAVVVRLRRRDAPDSRDEIVRGGCEVFLKRGGHAAGVDRGERLLLQLLREAQARQASPPASACATSSLRDAKPSRDGRQEASAAGRPEARSRSRSRRDRPRPRGPRPAQDVSFGSSSAASFREPCRTCSR